MSRKILFWLHLSVGVVIGLGILSMAVSGIGIAYERPITEALEHSWRHVAVPRESQRLGVETLIAKAREERPNARLTTITLYADPTASAMFSVGRGEVLFSDPYTGQVLGEGNKEVRAFFRWLTDWHRWLTLEGKSREIGKAFTGACALAFFGMLVSGLILWWPRQRSKSSFKAITVLDPKLKGKARDWNWHNVIGIWCSPLILATTLTGIIMSYSWANNLLFRAFGSEPPPPKRAEEPARRPKEASSGPFLEGLDVLWARAEKQEPGWQSIGLRLSDSTDAPAVFTLDHGNGARPDWKAQLTLDRKSGAVVRWEPYQSQTPGRKARSWVRFIHTGEAGGLGGQTLAAFSALGAILLVVTGLSLALRRFLKRRTP